MVEVLEPFEIGDSHTANIGEHVWNYLHSSSLENFVASESSGTICTLDNNFSLDMWSNMRVDDAIYGTWCEDIALLSHHEKRVCGFDLISIREIADIARLMLMHLYFIWVEALAAKYGRIFLDNCHDLSTLSMTILGKMVTYISEALYNDFLSSDAQADVSRLAEVFVIEHLIEHEVNTQSCGLSSSANTTLSLEFACSSSHRIDLLFTIEVEICIGDPSHDLLVGTHVWTEYV